MCNSCNIVRINGVLCHEQGCPDAWMDNAEKCAWCGGQFWPEFDGQKCCCISCNCAYNGYPDPDDELTDIDLLPDSDN